MKREKIKKYLLNNMETLKDTVYQINSYNDMLDWLEYYDNDDYFFDLFFENNPNEAVRASYYGNYNPNDAFVHFNAYGNLESKNIYAYNLELQEYIDDIVEALIHTYDDIKNYINDEKLKKLVEEVLENE